MSVRNIAWGYDEGDDWAHITSNISPAIEGAPIDFFSTRDVLRIDDSETGETLFPRGPS